MSVHIWMLLPDKHGTLAIRVGPGTETNDHSIRTLRAWSLAQLRAVAEGPTEAIPLNTSLILTGIFRCFKASDCFIVFHGLSPVSPMITCLLHAAKYDDIRDLAPGFRSASMRVQGLC